MTATVPCAFCDTLNRVDLDKADAGPKCGSCGKPILLDRPIKLSDENFQRVVSDTEVPVLVDCYADWCGPCKIIAPIMDEIAAARKGSVLVTKLDTDRNQQTTMQYDIRGIPTILAFRNGTETGRQVGAVPRQSIEALLPQDS